MACGVPVFATRVGGIEDYLQDGVNGYTITLEPEDIASKLELVFSDEALSARLRLGARATAMNYRWDAIALKYIELMTQIQSAKQSAKLNRPSASLPHDRCWLVTPRGLAAAAFGR